MEPFIGEIRLMAFNFAPRHWALCSGQIINIQSNTALFSILGTNYGGNGISTFGLPNLNGRSAIGAGQGPGLSNYSVGAQGGDERVTLGLAEMPAHGHALKGIASIGDASSLPGSSPALASSSIRSNLYSTAGPDTTMASAVALTGGNTSHNNMPPYLGLNFYIALQGIFPARN